jgi:excisionase family DNA binding protein
MNSIEELGGRQMHFPPELEATKTVMRRTMPGQSVLVGHQETSRAGDPRPVEAYTPAMKIKFPKNPRNSAQSCITLQAPQMRCLEDGKCMNLIEALRSRTTYLGTNEVVALIGVTRNTLCQWVRSSRITAIRVGNAYLFDPRILADWLEERQTKILTSRRAA